jgi:hypothetical protein
MTLGPGGPVPFSGVPRIVPEVGEDIYLPHIERMAIPIRFIHGAEIA